MTQAAIETRLNEVIRGLPLERAIEVLDFALFLYQRTDNSWEGLNRLVLDYDPSEVTSRETMLASEAVLVKEWDTPAEDKAWANL